MEIAHLTWLLRNLYAGQEATVRTGLRTTDWFQIGKGVRQGCILSRCLFNLYAEYIMWNVRLDEAQAGIKIAISWRIFQFVAIYTVKGFSIVNKAERDVFLELSCSFDDPVDVGNLISGSSAFSKSSLNIWKFSVHVLLKPSLKDFQLYLASMWNECNCVSLNILWYCPSLGLERKLTFSRCTSWI